MATASTGVERFLYRYNAYPHQKAFHESPLRHRLLGGAAGPGKTLALILDHMLNCNQFPAETAPQVHTLLLRRTYPKLDDTVITRFREKIPRELYREYNEQKHTVIWHNGSTTKFGAMQYEHDVWGYQGQWYKIGYDELTEFTFPQWQNISAWNRCPVSTRATKDGATNPIGVGARWVEDLFVKKQPCAEMDTNQRAQFSSADYGYFPATYLDNPIYAKDEQYIRNLDSYQGPVSKALKLGIWGIAGGYFEGAWDEAYNVYPRDSVQLASWWKRWLGADWGFDHNSVVHWFCMDDLGIVRIYRELVCNRHTPEELAERIADMSMVRSESDGSASYEHYNLFSLSHDAFAERQGVNTIGQRIGQVLQRKGIVAPAPSTKDKIGREQILYDYLKGRVQLGETFNDDLGRPQPVLAAKLQISDACPNLIRTIGIAPRDERNSEEIAEFLGDDALQSAGYGLYGMFGKPHRKPLDVRVNETVAAAIHAAPRPVSDTERIMFLHKTLANERKGAMPVRMKRWGRRPS